MHCLSLRQITNSGIVILQSYQIATTARIIATEKNAIPMSVQQVRKPKPMQIHPALTAGLLGFADVGRGGGEE
jgi:hypothetical protein